MIPQEDIRNFSIIAHIDHGKSTLSDRLIELCGAVDQREMEPQLLDNMDLERERGITIKARAVGLTYHRGGKTYTLNLIDTPGHVDFNYEVSRSLAACEGAVLIVDASQGVEAQTLANTYLALEHDLEILPVINKIDLPAADPQRTKTEIEDIIGLPAMDAPEISAKQGINIQAVLDDIVDHVPAPKGDPDAPLQALVFDSQYDSYRGVIVLMRIVAGTLRRGMEVTMMSTGASYKVLEVGHLRPIGLDPCDELGCGDVGYFTASIKNVEDTRVGDTVTETARPAAEPLPGYRPARSMVYCGIYTEDGSKYPDLRDALEKLQLNDASLTFEPESSVALGFGFRCGFLGMLHMEIIQERLEREFDLDLITTLPSVIYRITKTDGTVLMIDNPHDYPNPASIEVAEEPFVNVSIITPQEFVGNIMPLCQDLRGEYKNMQYLDSRLVELHYEMPLNEIVQLLRHAQGTHEGVRLARLRIFQLPPERARESGHAAQRRPGRRAELHRPQGQGLRPGAQAVRKAQGEHPAAAVRDPGAGRDRRQDHRARDRQGPAQGCARQVLRRRHHAQEKAARKAEGRQEENAPARHGPDPHGGISRRAQAR